MHSSNPYLSDKKFHIKYIFVQESVYHLQVIEPLLGNIVCVIPQLLHGGELLSQEDWGLGHFGQLLSPRDDVDDLLLLFVNLVHDLHVLLDDLLSLGDGAGEDLPGRLAKLLGGELHEGDKIVCVLLKII